MWEEQGEYERAFYSYQAAVKIIEEIRGKALIEEFKAGIVHSRFDVYEDIILVLARMGRPEEAFEYVERARARSLLDILGNTKIVDRDSTHQKLIEKERTLRAKISTLTSRVADDTEHRVWDSRRAAREVYGRSLETAQKEYQHVLLDLKLRNPEYAAMVSVEPFSSSQIQQLLDDETVILEYFVTDNNILIFVVTTESLYMLTVPEGRESLRGKITLFRGTAVRQMDEKKLSEQHWILPMQRLYNMLIAPVQDAGYLSSKGHLIIIPQGLLHYLPFQALIVRAEATKDGKVKPHFLIEDYTISCAPSASSLKFFLGKNTGKFSTILLVAPLTKILPTSEEEVVEIAALFGKGAKFYLNEKATESMLKTEASKYDLLHFATTGYFNRANPLFSRLDLAKTGEDDGNLEVYEIFGLNLDANLVTLSACQTALKSGYAHALPYGDDLVGLTRAFLYAGVPSVIASLWEVSDPSTSVLMQNFYRYLKQFPKAEALALAQRDMITGKIYGKEEWGHNDFSHPFFWSAFLLIGAWK